jgi:TPR repeat protein
MSSTQVNNINDYVTRFIAENGTDEMLEAWNNRNTQSFNENLLPPAELLISKSEKDPDAQYLLGVMYSKGVGVEKNDVIANYWYCEASKKGHSLAQSAMGKIRIEKETFQAEQQKKLSYLFFCADNKELEKDTLETLWKELNTDESRLYELKKYVKLAADILK